VATILSLRSPGPLGEAVHAERPNQVLHLEFLFMGPVTTGQKYILILKDDFSGFRMLHHCTNAESETTVTALMQWFTLFGVVPMWVSDGGSYFKNMIFAGVKCALHVSHHFTTAYYPWANGSV
jgi:transposase InsO family protein